MKRGKKLLFLLLALVVVSAAAAPPPFSPLTRQWKRKIVPLSFP